MHAVNHAITALAVKKVIPTAPLIPILFSVQAAEMLWVVLHYLEIEQTRIGDPFNSIADITFVHMPWSHSVLGAIVMGGVLAAVGAAIWRKWVVAAALFFGALSHVAIDILIHAPDIAISPFLNLPKVGLGPYGDAPVFALNRHALCGLSLGS